MRHQDGGPCGAIAGPDGSIRWRLWAPKAQHVELVLVDGDRRRRIAMKAEERGFFTHTEAGIAEGQRYAYRLNNGPERPDPAARWQPEGVHRPSAVLRTERFAWTDHPWSGVRRQDLVFYELHVGTFTPPGTFDAVIGRLDSLRDLGITAIQIMPVAQFPGNRGWGYDGVHVSAPQNSYGGPHGLQRLVDACHVRGLAIFLDVVYNHLGPEGNYLNEFGPYFSDRYRTFWGQALNYDSAGCDPVRDFILDNARLWIDTYHIDGLRLDAVHAIYDAGPQHILRAIKEAADAAAGRQGRVAHIIAESDLNDVRLMRPPEVGGLGLDAQWSDDFHHTVHAYLTGERQGYYVDYGRAQDFPKVLRNTFVLDGIYSRHRDRLHGAPAEDMPGDRFVVAIQNHDQVGNRARGDRLSKLVSPPAQRFAASLMLLAPHLPLLFMGEEYAETNPFLFFCSFLDGNLARKVREGRRKEFAAFAWQGEVPDPQAESSFAASRLSWSWPEGSHQAGMRLLYHDLLAARRSWPPMQDFMHRQAQLFPDDAATILTMVRGDRDAGPGKYLYIAANLTAEPQPWTAPAEGQPLLFSSESAPYHGERQAESSLKRLLPYECVVVGSADWEKHV